MENNNTLDLNVTYDYVTLIIENPHDKEEPITIGCLSELTEYYDKGWEPFNTAPQSVSVGGGNSWHRRYGPILFTLRKPKIKL